MKKSIFVVPAMRAGIGVGLAARPNSRLGKQTYDFYGRAVLITGGSWRLGPVIARQLADQSGQ